MRKHTNSKYKILKDVTIKLVIIFFMVTGIFVTSNAITLKQVARFYQLTLSPATVGITKTRALSIWVSERVALQHGTKRLAEFKNMLTTDGTNVVKEVQLQCGKTIMTVESIVIKWYKLYVTTTLNLMKSSVTIYRTGNRYIVFNNDIKRCFVVTDIDNGFKLVSTYTRSTPKIGQQLLNKADKKKLMQQLGAKGILRSLAS